VTDQHATLPPRYVRLRRGTVRVGQLATTGAFHPFAPDGHTGTACLARYGWVTDPRHAGTPTLPHAEVHG
jgi:hypothetical protein